VARDHHDGAGDLAGVDFGLEGGVDLGQAVGGHACRFGGGGGEELGLGGGGEEE